MATQQIEFEAPSGLTLTAKLFLEASDTVAYTASGVTEQANRKGVYRATFSSVAENEYMLIAFSGTDPVAIWWGNAADTASTFWFGNKVDTVNPAVGAGSLQKTLTINDGANPIPAVEVWVSSDLGGNNVLAGVLTTNAFGQVTFSLDAGTYYAWCQRAGFNFNNPIQFTVP